MTIGLCFSLGCIHANNVPRIYGSSGYTGSIVQPSVSTDQMCLVIGTEENKIEVLIKTMNALLL